MGETRVDLQHLLEDLRDAYPGAIEETILTEIVANSLDSDARRIRFAASSSDRVLTVVDDGSGMVRRELARYHDIASSTKRRGQGIGFAGVGIKLGLLACEEVTTETRKGKNHVSTRWHLASRHRAPWKWVPPAGLVAERGTAVTLRVHNPLSPLLDAGYIESALRRHYQPLFDRLFEEILSARYPHGVRFQVNERELPLEPPSGAEIAPIHVRIGRKRKPSAVGYLVRGVVPFAEEHRGVAVSTMGKVIKRGWDWLGLTPARSEHLGGLIEAPELSTCLTLSKADFIRSGQSGAIFLAYRRAVQHAVSTQLEAWGDTAAAESESRARLARPIERDLERVLIDLADDFPLLAALVERRAGGQRSLPIGARAGDSGSAFVSASIAQVAERVAEEAAQAEAQSTSQETDGSPPTPPPAGLSSAGPATSRKRQRYALRVDFESRSDSEDLARLVESTVWINVEHPAYRRAAASRSEGYHLALSVAMALAPLATEGRGERSFVQSFLALWGQSVDGKAGKR
jgi:hypothetical protein